MLRELQTTTGKVYDAMNTAAVAMVVGMGVVKDYTNKEVKFPAEATDKGIFFVTKEKRAEGIYAGLGEGVKLVAPVKAERYATDQFTAGAVAGDYLAVGTDGKFAKSESATRFVYRGTAVIDTHELHVVEVID